MVVNFPIFYGRPQEKANEFLDNLEMAHLISGRDVIDVKVHAFPLVLREEARTWYVALPQNVRENWDALVRAFSTRFGTGDTPKGMWQLLLQHQQTSLFDFPNYETKFQELWARWERSLANNQATQLS